MNSFLKTLVFLVSILILFPATSFSNVVTHYTTSVYSIPDIKAGLIEQGYGVVEGVYVPVTQGQQRKDIISKQSNNLFAFGGAVGGKFIYNSVEYDIESVINTTLGIMGLDESGSISNSYYGDNFCGDITYNNFLQYSNLGSNVSVFVFPDCLLVKVRSAGVNRYVNIFEVFRLMQEIGPETDEFALFAEEISELTQYASSYIMYANGYAGLAVEIELDNEFGYIYSESVEGAKRVFQYLKNCILGIVNNETTDIIPRPCWHETNNLNAAFIAGAINGTSKLVYETVEVISMANSFFLWCSYKPYFSVDPDDLSSECLQAYNNRTEFLKLLERISHYFNPPYNAGEIASLIVTLEEFKDAWLAYWDVDVDLSSNIINDIVTDCNAPIQSELIRKVVFCTNYYFDQLLSYPTPYGSSACLSFGLEDTGMQCAHDRGVYAVHFLEAVSGYGELKALFKSGKIADAFDMTLDQAVTLKSNRDDLKSGLSNEQKVVFDSDFAEDLEFMEWLDQDPNRRSAWENIYPHPNRTSMEIILRRVEFDLFPDYWIKTNPYPPHEVLFDPNSGGYIINHPGHNNYQHEIITAKAHMNQGDAVKLLDESGSDSSPDADINGVIYDIKNIDASASNIINNVRNKLEDAANQGAEGISIRTADNSEATLEVVGEAIEIHIASGKPIPSVIRVLDFDDITLHIYPF